MKPSPELSAYNLGVRLAVRANREDGTHEQGICVVCERRPTAHQHRTCSACRQTNSRRKNS